MASPLSGATPDPCSKFTNTSREWATAALSPFVSLHSSKQPPHHQSPANQETRRPMPKNTVTDPIADQEMAFARLVLSGTMNATATPQKRSVSIPTPPPIPNQNPGELDNLSHKVTRGIIDGQIKALSMIVAIEGLIPDRRLTPTETQPTAHPSRHKSTAAPRTAAPTCGRGAKGRCRHENPTLRVPGSQAGAYTRASPRTGERHVVFQP